MSIAPLPNGRLRVQVYDPATGKNVSVAKVLGLPRGHASWPNTRKGRREAEMARERAREILVGQGKDVVTVAQWRKRWLTDPLFARPKLSTMKHNAERTKAFAERYGDVAIGQVSDFLVAQWLAGGKNLGTVPALRTMFNDAMRPLAGRLIHVNPFSGLRIGRTKGNRHRQPPSIDEMERMVALAWDITPPSFAAYLEFACVVGIRPSELDALEWGDIDLENEEVHVRRQWSAKVGMFTDPKYGPYTAALVDRAREVLDRMSRDDGAGRYVFTTMRGHHYTPSTRTHHWNRVRAGVGLHDTTLYLATRHFFGWFALNVLGLPPHVIAEQLGHKDGGKLVVQLYGHPDAKIARSMIRDAHAQQGRVRLLRKPA